MLLNLGGEGALVANSSPKEEDGVGEGEDTDDGKRNPGRPHSSPTHSRPILLTRHVHSTLQQRSLFHYIVLAQAHQLVHHLAH